MRILVMRSIVNYFYLFIEHEKFREVVNYEEEQITRECARRMTFEFFNDALISKNFFLIY